MKMTFIPIVIGALGTEKSVRDDTVIEWVTYVQILDEVLFSLC